MRSVLSDEELAALRRLFRSREGFAGIGIAPRRGGWDLVLRIDGTYHGTFGCACVEELAKKAHGELVRAFGAGSLTDLPAGNVIWYGRE